MTDTVLVSQAVFQQWLTDKLKPEAVKQELVSGGFEEEAVKVNLKEYKRLLNSRKNFTGFIYMGLGSFIGFISCLLAILNPFSQWHDFFLFGLTSIAVLIVFAGLYLVFE